MLLRLRKNIIRNINSIKKWKIKKQRLYSLRGKILYLPFTRTSPQAFSHGIYYRWWHTLWL